MAVRQWVKDLVEEAMPQTLKIGMECLHPDGRKVKITDGQYWGERGVSNFWYWKEIKADGTLSSHEECGYGWDPRAENV